VTIAKAVGARPLAGRVVVVTRAREQADAFRALLEDLGASVLALPTIAIAAPDSWEPLDRALADLGAYQWVAFTSVNGVEMVRRRLAARGIATAALAGCRIAAIGPATARALGQLGLAPEVVPDEYVAEALGARLRGRVARGDRVLLPRAARTRDRLVRDLEAMGARVDEVAAYQTRSADDSAAALRAAVREGRVDAVTFTSSSTVRHFAALFPADELAPLMASVVVACIGPVTRATAHEHGLVTHVMPTDYTIPALARALAAHFEAARGAA
jgi:uroporphyrinogen III methyltransferase/synthase